ncbi:MAG: ubiquinol-cytochrome c reductase iron-sulfur subunit [Candidatus Limnocylindrales bacterium]
MSNYQVEPAARPQALSKEAIKALRNEQVQGVSRRQVLRTALGVGVGLWLAEVGAGTFGFIWPNLTGGFGAKLQLGKIDAMANNMDVIGGPTFAEGAPAHFVNARAFIVLIDPSHYAFDPGTSADGSGAETNVRTLYQRCTHLGCKPNFCPTNFWFECPCHGSRYDRLGIKVLGLGPAPRSLDRFASTVDAKGVLTVDTGKITLGPLPVALGQPGVIPPKSPVGCQ